MVGEMRWHAVSTASAKCIVPSVCILAAGLGKCSRSCRRVGSAREQMRKANSGTRIA